METFKRDFIIQRTLSDTRQDTNPTHQRLQVLLPLEIARSAGFDSSVHQAFSSRHAVKEELLRKCGSQVSKVAVNSTLRTIS